MKRLFILIGLFLCVLVSAQERKGVLIPLTDSTATYGLVRPVQADTIPALIIGSPCYGCCVTVIEGYYVLDYKSGRETYLDQNLFPLEDWIVWEHKELWWKR